MHLLLKKVARFVIVRGHQRYRISLVNGDTSSAIQ
jgi:hypothetical protein